MIENGVITRPHDWLEAKKMVLALPDDYNPGLHDLDSELLRGIGRMTRKNAPFDDDAFREMLENAIARTVFPSYSDRPSDMGDVIPSVLSEDVDDHPIDYFHELLSCLRMHTSDTMDSELVKKVWHAHELMKRNHIHEYHDSSTGTSLDYIIRYADSDDEIVLKAKLIDVIERSCSDDIGFRLRMMRLAFHTPLPRSIATMLAAVQSYFECEPDYPAALAVFNECIVGRIEYVPGIADPAGMVEPIDVSMFHDMLESCGGNVNAMSGLMHAIIELDEVDDQYTGKRWPRIHPSVMHLTLANLAEGRPATASSNG